MKYKTIYLHCLSHIRLMHIVARAPKLQKHIHTAIGKSNRKYYTSPNSSFQMSVTTLPSPSEANKYSFGKIRDPSTDSIFLTHAVLPMYSTISVFSSLGISALARTVSSVHSTVDLSTENLYGRRINDF